VEVFYLDDDNYIREFNFAFGATVANGSLSELGWKAGAQSSLTTYWPNIVYQDDSANLYQISYSPSASSWNRTAVGAFQVSNSSGLVVSPNDQFYDGYSVFGYGSDGELQQYNRSILDSTGQDWQLGT
jgi:hypothetical protein